MQCDWQARQQLSYINANMCLCEVQDSWHLTGQHIHEYQWYTDAFVTPLLSLHECQDVQGSQGCNCNGYENVHEDMSCATCQALQPCRQHKQERKPTSKAMNAKIGDRSIVPFNGGMIPLNRFRYGSQSVLQANNMS